MAENIEDEATGTLKTRRPAALLLISGLIALAISATAMIGPTTWNGVGNFHVGWIVVIGAIVVGAVLVLSPGRRS